MNGGSTRRRGWRARSRASRRAAPAAPRPRVTIVTSLSGASKPMPGLRDVVDHDGVEALARQLLARRARARAVPSRPRSRRAPGRPAARRRARRARPRCARARARAVARLVLLDLVRRAGRRGGSRPRRRPSAGRRGVELAPQASRSSAAVSHVDVPDAGRARQRDVRGDDRDAGAATRRLLGERQAHAPRRAVADEAHGVDRLARPARGDEHAQPVEVARRRPRRAPPRPRRAARAARAGGRCPTPPASRAARARLEHGHAARAQRARGWPRGRDARTSRRSSRARPRAGAGRRARPRSAGCPPGPSRAWRACWPSGRDRGRRRRARRARGARAARAPARGSPGNAPRSGSGSHSVTSTGAPVMPANDAAPTKRGAASVWMTRTAWPAFMASRVSSSAL